MKMRKLVAVLVAVLMLCCIIPFSAMAEGSSASIDFGDKANRVSYSTSQQVWAQNGITVTNDKAASTSNVGDYGGDGYPVRFYKGSAVTVEYPDMTKIEFNCDDYKASYATDLQASISGATATINGTVVTVAFDAPVNSFVIEQLVAQVRVDSINVYTGEGGDAPIIPDEPEIPSEDPEADTELSIADAIALGLSKERMALRRPSDAWLAGTGAFHHGVVGAGDGRHRLFRNPDRRARGWIGVRAVFLCPQARSGGGGRPLRLAADDDRLCLRLDCGTDTAGAARNLHDHDAGACAGLWSAFCYSLAVVSAAQTACR